MSCLKDKATVEGAVPDDHKKLVRYICKMEKQEKKKKRDKKNEHNSASFLESAFSRELQKLTKRGKRDRKANAMDQDDEDATPVIPRSQRMETETQGQEGSNNLLLKFDAMVTPQYRSQVLNFTLERKIPLRRASNREASSTACETRRA